MTDIKSHHESEAAALALELYNLNRRREQLQTRLNEISVILQTVAVMERSTPHPSSPTPNAVAGAHNEPI